MKTKYLFFAALAGMTFASCSSDDIANENGQTLVSQSNDDSIQFGFDMQNATRADKVGSDAATILQNQFIVYGTKHTSAEVGAATNDAVVFTNYKVEYTANTAGTKLSNTNNWDYVGLTPYAAAKVSPVATSQTVKYWDYSAENGYTFYGIASKADIETNNKVTVTKTTSGTTVYDKGYSVVIKSGAELDKLFVADRTPVAKSNFGKPVTLTFRNFGSRVRVGFYETIPGYSVKIDKFYVDGDATAAVTTFGAMDVANTTNFAASLQNIKTNPGESGNTMTVSYYNGTDGPVNQVKLGASTVEYNYSLVLGTGVVSATKLATSSATPTWDQAGGDYTTVYPFEANTNPMLVKVDYTLTAEDGGGEVIHVTGANVVIPTQYVKWKSNFAYTYIFKIAPNTNGTTDGTVQGLYPITFDAIVVAVADDKTQETITTFEDYSITSYSNGSKVTENDEYKKGKDIYVVKTDNSTNAIVAQTIGDDGVNKAQVYVVTQEAGADAISEATIAAKLNGAPNGIVLTAVDPAATLASSAPAADQTTYEFGTGGAVKFTPGAAGTYAYVSVRTVNVAAEYTAVGSSAWSGTTTYYFKTSKNVYYAANGINEANFDTYKASLYTQNASPTPVDGVYDIKIIKVVN